MLIHLQSLLDIVLIHDGDNDNDDDDDDDDVDKDEDDDDGVDDEEEEDDDEEDEGEEDDDDEVDDDEEDDGGDAIIIYFININPSKKPSYTLQCWLFKDTFIGVSLDFKLKYWHRVILSSDVKTLK